MTAWTAVPLFGSMTAGDWTALALVLGVIALWVGLQILTWRRERRAWHTETHRSGKVVRMHEERPEAPPHQRAA